jgi:hypothetical protein
MAKSLGESQTLERMPNDMGRRSTRLPLPTGHLIDKGVLFRMREGHLSRTKQRFISMKDT